MLEQILASTPATTVLGFLLSAPERSYTPAELKSRLRLTEARTTAALARLAREGIVLAFRKSSQRYYILNPRYKKMAEARAAVKRSRPQKDEMVAVIRRLGDIKAAFLSGVFTGLPQLPVDLLLVGRVNLKKLDQFLEQRKRLTGHEINYSIMSPEEFRQRRDTFDRFIKDIFDYRHLVVVDQLPAKKRSGPPPRKPSFIVSHF